MMQWVAGLVSIAIFLAGCGATGEVSAGGGGASVQGRGSLTMPVPRAAHSAVALEDGRVLLIGGCVADSCEGGPASGTVDIFDPRTGTIERSGTLAMRRVSTTAVRLASGQVLIAGGWVGATVSPAVELYDPATGTSRQVGSLSEARADIAAVTLADGRVLLAGGFADGAARGRIDIFDPATGTIAPAGDLVVPRAGAGAALLRDGRVLLVAGGTNGPGGLAPTESAEIFDPSTGQSAPTGSLAHARYKHATVGLEDGRVVVMGGSDRRDGRGKLTSIEMFDPASGSFSPAGNLLEARYKISGAVVPLPRNRILVAGGGLRAELYDVATAQSVAVGPDLGLRLNFATASLLPDGSVLLAGGYDENGIRMSDRAWLIRPDQG